MNSNILEVSNNGKGKNMHPLQQGYDYLMGELQAKIIDVTETKKTLNQMAKSMGIDLPFPDVSTEQLEVSGTSVRLDEFVNKAPSTALQEILNKRGKGAGAITYEDIRDTFKKGGFDFTKAGGEKAVRMTLIKNTTAFKFIRKQNAFGLKSWYKSDQKPKKKDVGKSQKTEEVTPKKKRGRTSKKNLEIIPVEPEKK